MTEQTEITEQTEKISRKFPFVPLFPFVPSSLLLNKLKTKNRHRENSYEVLFSLPDDRMFDRRFGS
jgi:hypothetical protein